MVTCKGVLFIQNCLTVYIFKFILLLQCMHNLFEILKNIKVIYKSLISNIVYYLNVHSFNNKNGYHFFTAYPLSVVFSQRKSKKLMDKAQKKR